VQTSLLCQSPLLKSLVKHFTHVPTQKIDQVMKLVARFTVGILDTDGLNKGLVPFSLDVRHAVRAWRQWALSSFYWGNLWRAIVTNDPATWKVHREDVDLIRSYLSRSDLACIEDMYFVRSVSRLSAEVIMDLQVRLRNWAWVLYHKHLRFIAQYDKGLSSEDLVASVMEAGLKALRRYEHQNNPKKTLNFAKRAAKNEAINIIGRYTRRKRARIVATKDDPTRQFLCRTVSFEEVQPILEKQVASDPLYDYIRVQLGHEYERYARAILGEWPAFDEWVATTHDVETDRLPRRKLERFAREWSGITTEQARRNLAPLLVEKIRESDYLASSQPT
jgi:DNA-directed RNA polymerase specialized sigma24 family protein